MERHGASIYYRNDGQRSTTRTGKHQRRPRTLPARVPQDTPLLCLPCFSGDVRTLYRNTRADSPDRRRKVDRQYPLDAIALRRRCIRPPQHPLLQPHHQPGEIGHLYGKYHRTSRAPAPHRLSINTTGRKHLRNGGRKRVPQHRMAVRVARLCPAVHRTKSKSLTTRPASFPPYRSRGMCRGLERIARHRRPAPRHFPHENPHSRRMLFPRHEACPCRNPARMHRLPVKKEIDVKRLFIASQAEYLS